MAEVTQNDASLMDLAVVLSPRARLEEIRLANSTVRSQNEVLRTAGLLQAEFAFDAESELDQEAKQVVVRAFFTVCAKVKPESGIMDAPMRIDAEFVAVYTVGSLEGIESKHVKAFGEINGIHNLWPYWREYVQSTTVRIGSPPLVLPLMTGASIVGYYKSRKQSTQRPPVSPGGLPEQASRNQSL